MKGGRSPQSLTRSGGAQLIEPSGRVQGLDAPLAADTLDDPPEQRPQIVIHFGVVEDLERIGQGVDLDPVWKRLTATPDEHQRIDHSGRSAHIAGPRQTRGIQREAAHEKTPDFRVVSDPILGQHKRPSCSVKLGIIDDFNLRHDGLPSMRSRKWLIFCAISTPESSCKKCRPVTSSYPSACGRSFLKRVANVV